jgi:hypothetical protein
MLAFLLLLPEHLQHSLRHQKAAEDVDARQQNTQGAEDAGERDRLTLDVDDLQHRADDDDAGNGVGYRHKRRMQRGRHVPHHVVAHENRQYEDGQIDNKRIDITHEQLPLVGFLCDLPANTNQRSGHDFVFAIDRQSASLRIEQDAKKGQYVA